MDDIIKQLRKHYAELDSISRKIVKSDIPNKDVLDVCLHIDKARLQISLANLKIEDCS